MDERLFFNATTRNRGPIGDVLERILPRRGVVLEIASGSGEHVTAFAERFAHERPELRWQPSDPEPEHRASIAAWTEHANLGRIVSPALDLDVTATWPAMSVDMVFNANMVHISPWSCTEGLLDGAAAALRPGAALVMYGPFMRHGRHTAPSNAAFDERLRARDPSWGVRDLEVIAREAAERGLRRDEIFEMPANNLTVVYRRDG